MTALMIVIYLILLLVWLVASFFALYQLYQFGYVGDASLRAMISYVVASFVVIIASLVAMVSFVR